MGQSRHRILLIDDDKFFANYTANVLEDVGGYSVTQCHCVDEGLQLVRKRKFPLVIVDLKMPPGESFRNVDTSGGHRTGLVLAREIRKLAPFTKVLIQSAIPDAYLQHIQFKVDGGAFFLKSHTPTELIRAVERIMKPCDVRRKSFIVHGRDTKTAIELKNYLQNRLRFEEPTILAEQPSRGATILEKFEAHASGTDWVFVLFTPDDMAQEACKSEPTQPRARQNVIFELGYFLGLMKRQSGRIILLYRGPLEIPSDLGGIAYVDIGNGIEAAGEDIRRNVEL